MKPRTDEEVAQDTLRRVYGIDHPTPPLGIRERDLALVAAGRAEGQQEYQLKLRYLQQGVADLRAERDELAEAVLRLNKMGLRAERRGWIEALTWVLDESKAESVLPVRKHITVEMQDRIRARLREMEGEK